MSMLPSTAAPPGTEGVPARAGPLLTEFEEVYRDNVATMTAFFARRSRDPQVVADLTAETFVEAITSFATFDPHRGSARGWLFGIARRVFAQHAERHSRGQDVLEKLAGRRPLEDDEADDVARRIDAERAGRALIERLAGLPALDREAVELVDLAGLTPKEAAAALRVSPGALRIRLFRARTKLRASAETGQDNG